MNLKGLTLKQLTKLRTEVDAAIEKAKLREMEIAKTKLEKVAKKLGYSLAELVQTSQTSGSKPKASRKSVAPKYQNPADTAETWTGRGRKPLWVQAALDAGQSLSDLEIS
jgi:DNA-binding protein H-NS